MRDPDRLVACRNCGREHRLDELDRGRWCRACRREVLRRARIVARLAAVVVALALAAWIFLVVGASERFFIGYAVIVAAAAVVTYKLVQRVAFEVIRGRSVRPPEA